MNYEIFCSSRGEIAIKSQYRKLKIGKFINNKITNLFPVYLYLITLELLLLFFFWPFGISNSLLLLLFFWLGWFFCWKVVQLIRELFTYLPSDCNFDWSREMRENFLETCSNIGENGGTFKNLPKIILEEIKEI